MWQKLLKKNFFRLWQDQEKSDYTLFRWKYSQWNQNTATMKLLFYRFVFVYSKKKDRKNETDLSSLYTLCDLTDVQNVRDR